MTARTDPVVDTQVWEPDPDRPGGLQLVRTKPVGEVFAEIRRIVGQCPPGGEEYFTVAPEGAYGRPDRPWPANTRIACFAVTGANEGHYVHVGAVHDTGHYRALLIAKTFSGREAAWGFAQRIAAILQT